MRAREKDLLREVERLKAALFSHEQDEAVHKDGRQRKGIGLDTDIDIGAGFSPSVRAPMGV